MKNLIRLDLSDIFDGNKAADEFVTLGLKAYKLPLLEIFIFNKNGLTSSGLARLFDNEGLKNLKVLGLKENEIKKIDGSLSPYDSVKSIEGSYNLRCDDFMKLQVLDITGNGIRTAGMMTHTKMRLFL